MVHSTSVHAQCGTQTYEDDGSCRACPEGAVCDCTGVTVATLFPADTFWRTGPTSHELLPCPIPDGCTRNVGTCDAARVRNETCAHGYKGVKCAVCIDGYHYSKLADKCNPCTARKLIFTVLATGVGVALLFLVLLLNARGEIPLHFKSIFLDISKFKVRSISSMSS